MHYFLKFIFGIKLRVSDSSSVHLQEFFTAHTAMVYVIKFADSLRAGSGRNVLILLANCDIYHCCVYSEKLLMMDRGTVRTM